MGNTQTAFTKNFGIVEIMFGIGIAMALVRFPALLLALTVHEWAHAYVAWRFGDSTAKDLGRVSLNPLVHLDPVGTIGLIIGFIGWGKPVPVDPRNLRDPKKAMLWISAAGPISNIILALFFGLALRLMVMVDVPFDKSAFNLQTYIIYFCSMSIIMNLALAVFNMIPLFPLDGSKVVQGLLPMKKAIQFGQLQKYGPWILIGLLLLEFNTNMGLIQGIILKGSAPLASLFSGLEYYNLLSILGNLRTFN